jgi:hypothetical protein
MEAVETMETQMHWTFGNLLFVLVFLVLAIIPWWKIWQRTGHSGAWSLLMLIPIANIISIWVLAFKDWPTLRR